MLIAPNTIKDKIRRLFTLNFSFHGFSKILGYWGSIASISGLSCYSIYKNDVDFVIIALLALSFIALFYQYKYYHHIEKINLANSLHYYRHQISEEIRYLDEYFYNLIKSNPVNISETNIENDTSSHYDKICAILQDVFLLYGIKTSGIFIKSLDQKNMILKTVAKKCSRQPVDEEPLKENLFVRMLINCLTNNEQLISDFNQKNTTSLPKVPINQNPEIACLSLCNFESNNFPSSFNEILNEQDSKVNNTHKNKQQDAELKKRINGKYKSCLGFTISNHKQKANNPNPVFKIPVVGFIGMDSQNPHDFEKIDKPFMEFLAGTADSLYTTIQMKTVMADYAKQKT